MRREFVRFATRQDRPRWLRDRFGEALDGTLLDVGCDEAVLRDYIGAERYTGVDRSEAADVHHDLQAGGPLPFDDRSFDVVVCTDVLEHLDNLHAVFEEIVRVARHRVVISLPNNWNAARMRLQRGHGSFAHYGLPLDPPADRHRWFFNLQEACEFLDARAARHGLRTVDRVVCEKPRLALVRALRRVRYPSLQRYLNLYSHTVVYIMERVAD